VDLGLALILVPSLGATGAVVGNCAGQVISFGCSLGLIRHYAKLPVRSSVMTLVPFSCAAAVGTLAASAAIIAIDRGVSPWPTMVVVVAASSVVTILTVRLVGGAVDEADLAALTSAFPRRGPGLLRLAGRAGWLRSADRRSS
jgi:hypothetical protein